MQKLKENIYLASKIIINSYRRNIFIFQYAKILMRMTQNKMYCKMKM